MKNKKKSFYFDDYAESELIDNNKSNVVKVSLNKVTFLSFIFFSLILIFGIKIIYLSLSSEKSFFSNNTKKEFVKKRRDIVDRNGSVISTNVILYDVGVRPKLLKEKAVKMPASDIDAFLKHQNVDEIKELCEKMYHNGEISRTGNYRYFILTEEKEKPKPKKTSAPKSEEVDVEKELEKLKGLLDKGLITQEQYDAKSNELLGL